jgi:dTDP-4-amino-4,6-dideoxygalactose transaminase
VDIRIPFNGRPHHYTESEIATVVKIMLGSSPLTQGDCLRNFEKRFEQYVCAEHAFALSNATAGLELAAQLCQFKRGDEVIIPAHTFTSSAYPFVKNGAMIVWSDIDLSTRVVTAETIASCITSNTRAVVVPHLYGYGADIPSIMALAEKHGFLVIEDAAQALGVIVEDRMVGTYGDFGIFSFHAQKNVTTLGEGGMLIVRDTGMAELIPMLRHNGHCPYPPDRHDYWIPAMGDVDLPVLNEELLWPSNYCIGEVECALGEKLLGRVDEINIQKRRRALSVIDRLSVCPDLVFHREASLRHNYHLLVAQVANNLRNNFIRHMAIQYGIQCVVQYYPLNRYPFYQKLGFGKAECPSTDVFFDNMISFPFSQSLTDDEIDLIVVATLETLDYLS